MPILSFNPIGWAILGAAGFLTYKAGKKAGLNPESDIETPNMADRAVKGAMKTAYKTKKCVEEGLTGAKEKYGAMWAEAREEVITPE